MHFQVERSDKLTKKLCQSCFDKIDFVDRFRELVAVTNNQFQLKIALQLHNASEVMANEYTVETPVATIEDQNTSISSVIENEDWTLDETKGTIHSNDIEV